MFLKKIEVTVCPLGMNYYGRFISKKIRYHVRLITDIESSILRNDYVIVRTGRLGFPLFKTSNREGTIIPVALIIMITLRYVDFMFILPSDYLWPLILL